jgi:hypothetical protein
MGKPATFDQAAGEIIQVEAWEPDDEFPVMPLGQKPKRVLICPTPAPHRFLIAGHRYLFKEPAGHTAQQVWSEVIAYKLARAVGVDVPPAFLGYDGRRDSPGVVVEFFFGHGERADARFVHARDRFQALGFKLDERRGSLAENIKLSRQHQVPDPRLWWAQTLAFDTLTGNTDRHSENWGFLIRRSPDGRTSYELAPAFDNGSSLGWIVREPDLPRHLEAAGLRRFVERGQHHYGWLSWDDGSARHVELARRFVARHGISRPTIARIAGIAESKVEAVLCSCREFDFPVRFSERRAAFVLGQIRARRIALEQALGG